jgi:hypothetical protein
MTTSSALSYRRQFFLGVDALGGFPSWNRQEIAGKYRLCAHPDLPLTHVERGPKSITLLGYILDPDDPTASDAAIVTALAAKLAKSGDLPLLTSRLGGRWVIVAHDGDETVVFHDAAGQRQIYYYGSTTPQGRSTVCASQPGLIAETFGLAPDPAALDYIDSRGDSDTEVYWLPGDRSPYRDVRALLPNHLLRLESGVVARYWPVAGLPPMSYEQGLRETAGLLRGLVESARLRYPFAVAMTAGWDSRLMLALSKGAAGDLYCYTMTYPGSSDDTRDVYVPAKLLAKLGIAHHLLRYPEVVDEAFKAIAKKSSSSVHANYCADVQALHESYPADRLSITGDVAEVVKVHYRLRKKKKKKERLTAADLASVSKVGPHPFALAAFESWLEGVAGHDAHIDLLDLFCWEQMGGRWHAQIRAEYDIVQESFAPLNCRAVLLTMLAVDERHRVGPGFGLLRELIELLWKDVLRVPINPREKVRVRRVVLRVLHRLHISQLIPRGAKDLAKRVLRRGR